MSDSLQKDISKSYSYYYKTNNYYEKLFIINSLYGLIDIFPNDAFLLQIFNEINADYGKNYALYQTYDARKKNEFILFTREHKDYINDVIPLDSEIEKEVSLENYSREQLLLILFDFLSTISVDLAKYVKEMFGNGRILIGNENCKLTPNFCYDRYNGYMGSLYLGNQMSYYIYINYLFNLCDLLTLVHEIGHAYYSNLNDADFNNFNSSYQIIKNEIPAKMLEILFIRYLISKGMLNEARELIGRYNTRIKKDKESADEYLTLKYSIGSFVGSQYADAINDFSLEFLYQFIFQNDFKFHLQQSFYHFTGFALNDDLDDNFKKNFLNA